MASPVLGTTPDVYRSFIEALNRQDLDAATRLVDTSRYRENCVGFTNGFVDWEGARDSIRRRVICGLLWLYGGRCLFRSRSSLDSRPNLSRSRATFPRPLTERPLSGLLPS